MTISNQSTPLTTRPVLDNALALHARGFSIIPVPLPRNGTPKNTPGDGKTPAIRWKQYQTERASEAQIRGWFREPQNVVTITGAISGIVVVDADSDAAKYWAALHLPYTPWQVQTARGYHLYYRHDGTRIRNQARIDTGDEAVLLDVRGDGGYVVAPGSVHMSGAVYTPAAGWDDPARYVPVFSSVWLAPTTTTVVKPATRRSLPVNASDEIDRARRYVSKIPRPEIGHGSDAATFYVACRLVRRFNLTEADALALLEDWAPAWDRAWLARKVQSAARYGTEPIGGAA